MPNTSLSYARGLFNLIQETRLLLEEESVILASSEDAAYFRAQAKRLSIQKPSSQAEKVDSHSPNVSNTASNPSTALSLHIQQGSIKQKEIDRVQPETWNFERAKTARIEDLKPAAISPIDQVAAIDSSEPSRRSKSNFQVARSIAPSFSQLRSIVAHALPELALLDAIPNDDSARRIATKWKTRNQSAPISVLIGGETPQHKAFLEEIAVALDVYFGPARCIETDGIEKEKQWESFLSVEDLKLIVICDSTLWQLHQLRQFYKEIPASGARFLGKTPLFLLPDVSLYLKDHLLKKSLWKALCQKLS